MGNSCQAKEDFFAAKKNPGQPCGDFRCLKKGIYKMGCSNMVCINGCSKWLWCFLSVFQVAAGWPWFHHGFSKLTQEFMVSPFHPLKFFGCFKHGSPENQLEKRFGVKLWGGVDSSLLWAPSIFSFALRQKAVLKMLKSTWKYKWPTFFEPTQAGTLTKNHMAKFPEIIHGFPPKNWRPWTQATFWNAFGKNRAFFGKSGRDHQ